MQIIVSVQDTLWIGSFARKLSFTDWENSLHRGLSLYVSCLIKWPAITEIVRLLYNEASNSWPGYETLRLVIPA